MNKSVASGKTEASKQIRALYEIKKGDLDRYLKIKKASPQELLAELTGTYSRLSKKGFPRIQLIRFGVKQSGTKIGRAKGRSVSLSKGKRSMVSPVMVKIRKDRGWKPLDKRAFVARMTSGHIGVFQRITGSHMQSSPFTSREKIRELSSVDIPLMFASRGVMDKTKARIGEQWQKNFSHEMEYELGR